MDLVKWHGFVLIEQPCATAKNMPIYDNYHAMCALSDDSSCEYGLFSFWFSTSSIHSQLWDDWNHSSKDNRKGPAKSTGSEPRREHPPEIFVNFTPWSQKVLTNSSIRQIVGIRDQAQEHKYLTDSVILSILFPGAKKTKIGPPAGWQMGFRDSDRT
jgi:hypothetical protein